MGKKILLVILLFGAQSLLWCNPSDYMPIAKFSELVFDNNNNWTMEIYFPINTYLDSIIFNISGKEAKLKASYLNAKDVIVITSDSLTNPLTINRDGDKIIIYSYSWKIQEDSIIFGNYPGASVGAPDSGYSILRYYTLLASNNYLTLDCLTKRPSLGIVNDTVGLAGTLKGHIYDNENRLINNYDFPDGTNYVFLEGLLNISPDGFYTTSIFNTIYKPGFLDVQLWDFEGCHITLKIAPFELNNIHPDTVVFQDIHLIDSCLYCTLVNAVKKNVPVQSDELTLINYPNPFSTSGSSTGGNQSTNFFIKIPGSMKGMKQNINIYNVHGQLIRILPVSGSSTVSWDSKDKNGRKVSSGVYYYRLIIDNQVMKNGSMILLK